MQPIPLELLSIKEMEEVIPQSGVKRSSSSILPALRNTGNEAKKGEGWPVTFRHLGKNGYELMLYASNQSGRQKWLEFIDKAQQRLRARADFLTTTTITSGFFAGANKVNCVAPFGKFGERMALEPWLTLSRRRPQAHLRNRQRHLHVGSQVQGQHDAEACH
jgi:hypothetical protein